jgi:hypothetical protein
MINRINKLGSLLGANAGAGAVMEVATHKLEHSEKFHNFIEGISKHIH